MDTAEIAQAVKARMAPIAVATAWNVSPCMDRNSDSIRVASSGVTESKDSAKSSLAIRS